MTKENSDIDTKFDFLRRELSWDELRLVSGGKNASEGGGGGGTGGQ